MKIDMHFMEKNIIRVLLFWCVIVFVSFEGYANSDDNFVPYYKYRVYLKDKGRNVKKKLKHPERFLSKRALERRERQGIKLDITDVPVCLKYVKKIESVGVDVILRSKWNNTVVVQCEDTMALHRIKRMHFVEGVECVAFYDQFPNNVKQREEGLHLPEKENPLLDALYGKGESHIKVVNGLPLHEDGCRGEGMMIAVIDGGFRNMDRIDVINTADIVGTYNFVAPGVSVYDMEADHGLSVVSCMASRQSNVMIGTAPNASYWLLVSEDSSSEQLVEEDCWAAAIEFADSVGADVVNSSLGYDSYGNPRVKIPYGERNGKAHLISRSASMVASKGMILCNAVGNNGEAAHTTISLPADAENILTIGSIAKVLSSNSSQPKLENGYELFFFLHAVVRMMVV